MRVALAALLVSGATWWLVRGEPRPASSRARERDTSSSVARDPAAVAELQPAEIAAGPTTEDRREVPPAEDASLHRPDYGPDLCRPRARAEFELRDARGRAVEGAFLSGATLRRRVGEARVEHAVVLEREASRLVCGGPHAAGLPPGDYELEVRAGPYGTLRESFALQRDDVLRRTLELPRWRRIVRLRFVDGQGRPVAKITQAPEYAFADAPPAGDAPLGADPRDSGPAATLLARFSAESEALPLPFGRSNRGWEACYETDAGAFHVRVFAGLPARVTVDLERDRYAHGPIVLESDFAGPEWEDYPVTVEPAPGLEARMATWVLVNPGDPGARSLLADPEAAAAGGGDPAELGDLSAGRIRVVVSVDAPVPVRMLTEAGVPERAIAAARARREATDVWYVDVLPTTEAPRLLVRYSFTDDRLFRSEDELLELTRATLERPCVEARARPSGVPLTIEVVPRAPTLAAGAESVSFALRDESGTERTFAIEPDGTGALRVASALSPRDLQSLSAGARVAVAFRAGDGEHFRVERPLEPEEREALGRGLLRLEVRPRGLAFRAVDAAGNGVAGLRGALVRHEGLELAERKRQALLAAAAARTASAPQGAPDAGRPSGWLDDRSALRSDRDGYVLADHVRLEEGRRYVLFLWSGDPLSPERRVDFVAEADVTDLGVVRVPGP